MMTDPAQPTPDDETLAPAEEASSEPEAAPLPDAEAEPTMTAEAESAREAESEPMPEAEAAPEPDIDIDAAPAEIMPELAAEAAPADDEPTTPKPARSKKAKPTPETVEAVPASAAESAGVSAPEPEVVPAPEEAPPAEPIVENKKRWYVIKVASGQEESIRARLERNVKVEGLEEFISQIIIPVERITEVRKIKKTENGEKVTKEKRVIKERKKYPGYLMAEVEFNDQVLYLFRETNGVGDFVGGGPGKPPAPMSDREVAVMLGTELPVSVAGELKTGRKVKVKIDIEKGDKVRLRDGAFAGTEGEVLEIVEAKDESETPKITVEVQFWGRPVRIDSLEYWQVDKV